MLDFFQRLDGTRDFSQTKPLRKFSFSPTSVTTKNLDHCTESLYTPPHCKLHLYLASYPACALHGRISASRKSPSKPRRSLPLLPYRPAFLGQFARVPCFSLSATRLVHSRRSGWCRVLKSSLLARPPPVNNHFASKMSLKS